MLYEIHLSRCIVVKQVALCWCLNGISSIETDVSDNVIGVPKVSGNHLHIQVRIRFSKKLHVVMETEGLCHHQQSWLPTLDSTLTQANLHHILYRQLLYEQFRYYSLTYTWMSEVCFSIGFPSQCLTGISHLFPTISIVRDWSHWQ
jgi:hypothetical protein